MMIEGVVEWFRAYWTVVVSVFTAAAGGTTVVKNVLEIRRGRREDAAKHTAAQREDGHRQWTDKVHELLCERDASGGTMSAEISFSEREHVHWAVKNGLLTVMHRTANGGFIVILDEL